MRTVCAFSVMTALLLSGGCGLWQRKPHRLASPPILLDVDHRLGSPLRPDAPVAADARPLLVTVSVQSVRRLPESRSASTLASLGRLIVDANNQPLATAPPLAERIRFVPEARELEAVAPVGSWSHRFVLPAGTSLALSLVAAGARDDEPRSALGTLVLVSPAAAANVNPQLLLTAPADAGAMPTPGSPAGRSTVVVEWPIDAPPEEFALLIPSDPSAGVALPTIWRVRMDRHDDDAELARRSEEVLATLAPPAPVSAADRRHALAAVLAAASTPDQQRRRLLFVAAETDATVTADAALVLDDAAIGALVSAAADGLRDAPDGLDGPAVGWRMDRSVLQSLGAAQGQNRLPPEAIGLLVARFGEVGVDAAAVAEMAGASTSREDFRRRVVAEHVIRLDDASPSARVRAYDWLTRQRIMLVGYDPLAPRKQRRQSVEQYLSADPATQPSVQP